MNLHRISRRLSAGAAAVVLTGAGIALLSTTANAADPDDFELLVAANALDIHIQDNSIPVTQVVDFSPYGSTATLSSTGVAKSDAGAPYAPFGYSLPSTVTGLGSGLLPSIPPFPGYVAASNPVTPTSSQKTGGYELTASASDVLSRGEVKLGSQPAGSTDATGFSLSEARANSDGTVTVTGKAGSGLLSFGGVLDLGRVSSVLSMTVPESGKPVITGNTDLGTVTLATDFVNGVRDGKTYFAGQPVPLTPDSISDLNAALAPSGVALTYLPQTYGYTDGTASQGTTPNANKTIRSIISGGLLVTTAQKVPTQGEVTGRYTLGRVSLSATNVALPGADVDITTTGGGLGTAAAPLDGTASAASGTGVDSAAELGPTSGTDAGAVPGAGTVVSGAPSNGADQTATVNLTPQSSATSFAGEQAATSSKSFYLMLVVGAVLALAGAQLVRFFAVKA
jgi:hypothetical protein